MEVRVIADKYNQFGIGAEIGLKSLVNDFIAGLSKDEDKEIIQSLTEWMNNGNEYYAMNYIANVWEITLEEIDHQ